MKKKKGSKEKKVSLDEFKEALTSNYVLMEFKRTILKDCIVLYSFLKEEKSLEDTFRRISELRDYEHRTASRINLILSKLSENSTLEYEKINAGHNTSPLR